MIKARSIRWARKPRNAIRILGRNLKGRYCLQRPRNRWEDNNQKDLKEYGYVWAGLMWLRIGALVTQ